MYPIEKIDITEKLFRKVGSDHEPEARDAARRLRALCTKWEISVDELHSTSSQRTEFLRRRTRYFWDQEDPAGMKESGTVEDPREEDL